MREGERRGAELLVREAMRVGEGLRGFGAVLRIAQQGEALVGAVHAQLVGAACDG